MPTLIYPKNRLPKGRPLQDQFYDLLDELERLLDRADVGKKNVYLVPFLAHFRAFLNHAEWTEKLSSACPRVYLGWGGLRKVRRSGPEGMILSLTRRYSDSEKKRGRSGFCA